MLRSKGKVNISELQGFFTSSEKVIAHLFRVISSLTISKNLFSDKSNSRYLGKNKLILLLLFPFFSIKNAYNYEGSALHRFMACGKDVFYRTINDSRQNWRKLLYQINRQLMRMIVKKSVQKSIESKKTLRCLIVDDTDFPKTGHRIELIGRIYSHISHKAVLGFKGLFLGYHDGTSFQALDFSIHGEKGKNAKKPYGMPKKELNKRYSKKRDSAAAASERIKEYAQTKISSMISMIQRAIENGVRFDYLLVDSWFTCHELVKFIKTRSIFCHFLGMIKMGNTRYDFEGKQLTSKEIVEILKRKKKIKRSKSLNCWHGEAMVVFQGIEVKLFFCKTSRKGNWHGLLSTDVALCFEEAYKIYATRWAIEVFYKECKQYLGLGKCQSQDFAAQIAHTSICILQYNILSVVKRFESYETMGILFREIQQETLELTICERIWLIITEIMNDLADFFEIEMEALMEKILSDNERFMELINLKSLSQTG